MSKRMIVVTKACLDPTRRSSDITFSGTITNTGDVTLKNVTLTDQTEVGLSAITLSTTTLAPKGSPGDSVSRSGTYVPTKPGGIPPDTLAAQAQDRIKGDTDNSQD